MLSDTSRKLSENFDKEKMRGCMTFPINFIVTLFNNKYAFEIFRKTIYFVITDCIYMFSIWICFSFFLHLIKLILIIKMSCQNFQVSSFTLPPAIFIYLSDSRIKIAANQTFVLRCFIISDFYLKWQPVYNIFLHIHTRIHFD